MLFNQSISNSLFEYYYFLKKLFEFKIWIKTEAENYLQIFAFKKQSAHQMESKTPSLLETKFQDNQKRNKSQNHQCPQCHKTSKQAIKLANHITAVHEKLRSHLCHLCPQTFGYSDKLQVHIKQVHLRMGLVKCKVCSKDFQSNASLRRHVESVHDKVRHLWRSLLVGIESSKAY